VASLWWVISAGRTGYAETSERAALEVLVQAGGIRREVEPKVQDRPGQLSLFGD